MDTEVQESTQAARTAAQRALMSGTDGQGEANGNVKLVDQLVLSTAALATEGIDVARIAVSGTVHAVDAVILATLDTAESFVRSNPLEPLAAAPLDVARQVWSTSAATLNEVLAQV